MELAGTVEGKDTFNINLDLIAVHVASGQIHDMTLKLL